MYCVFQLRRPCFLHTDNFCVVPRDTFLNFILINFMFQSIKPQIRRRFLRSQSFVSEHAVLRNMGLCRWASGARVSEVSNDYMLKKSWDRFVLDGTKCRVSPTLKLFTLEDEDTPFIRNVGKHLPKDIVSYPRRPKSPVKRC